ncbi:MAG TPA: response regulator, partial [Myxococcota bacterium]|nr:response regulator [Myxococcota bacterium]
MLKWQPQIYVVDDNPIVQSAWRNWLNKIPNAEIHMYPDAESFLASFVPGGSGILILDNHMPGMTGMELIERYVPRQIDVPVLMVTAFADVQMAVRAVKTGVVNVLEKPLRGDELLEAVQKILDKEQQDWPRRQEAAELRASLASLTSREREVMMELLEGRSN